MHWWMFRALHLDNPAVACMYLAHVDSVGKLFLYVKIPFSLTEKGENYR